MTFSTDIKHLISSKESLATALAQLNMLSDGNMTLIAVDENGIAVGSLTDGDVRRAILSGVTLDDRVEKAMRKNFISIVEDGVANQSFSAYRDKGIKLLPVVSKSDKLIGLIDLTKCKACLNLSALIMAGGKGERLRPATLTTPKPLLPINGKPIIDYGVELLNSYGISDITVATRYLSQKIIDHFEGSEIECVVEDKPLGTIGALSLLSSSPTTDIIVMNADLLTDIPLDEMYAHHRHADAAITVAAIPYTVSVPYAILTTEGTKVKAIEEKPTYSFYANAGIYIVNPKALSLVPIGEPYDATSLIEDTISSGLTVSYFPISGTWIDIGSPTDFKHAEDLLSGLKTTSKIR